MKRISFSEQDIQEIMRRYESGESNKTIGKTYGCSPNPIRQFTRDLVRGRPEEYIINNRAKEDPIMVDFYEADLSKDYLHEEVEYLTPRQIWFIRKHLSEGDFEVDDIAEDVDCQPVTVWLIHNNKIYKNVGFEKSEALS